MAEARERRGVRDGNDRIARIGRWLAARPKSDTLTELVLILEGDEILARWALADVSNELAYQIDAIMLDAANDAATTISCKLVWMAGETHYLSKGFRARCEKEEQENIKPLDGTPLAWLSQAQRHTEASNALLATIIQRSEERVERFLGIQERMLEKCLTALELETKRREAAEAAEQEALELASAAAAAGEQVAAEADAAAAKGQDPMGQVIEIATKQLLAGGAPTKG